MIKFIKTLFKRHKQLNISDVSSRSEIKKRIKNLELIAIMRYGEDGETPDKVLLNESYSDLIELRKQLKGTKE